jgi:SAM-dependent methyltransferase
MSAPRPPQEVLAELVPIDGRVVVDVGCGTGALVRWLTSRGAEAVGVEIEPGTLARAREQEPAGAERYVEGGGEALPLDDDFADVVVFGQSLHHVPAASMDGALAEAARVARPGGTVYVQEPVAQGEFFELLRMVDDETEVRALAQAALRRAGDAGLRLEREVSFDAPVALPDFEALRDLVVSADPLREARLREVEPALRAAFAATAGRTLRSPCVVHVFSS